MPDHLVRAFVEDADLRALAVVATDAAREAAERHGCAGTAGLALSEGILAGLLLARLHKLPRRVNLQIACDGPLRGVVVDADAEGRVRGYARVPSVDFPSRDGSLLGPAFGTGGLVNVLREMTPGTWYQGTVEMPARSIARGVEAYLSTSEQVESVIHLVVRQNAAGGIGAAVGVLFQRLPEGNRAAMAAIRARLDEGVVSEWLDAQDAGHLAAGQLLDHIMGGPTGKGGENLEFFDRTGVAFHCDCDRERVIAILGGLPADDLAEMIEEGRALVTCDFCGDDYEVPAGELRELLAAKTRR